MARNQNRRKGPWVGQDVDGVLYQWGQAARDALVAKFGGTEVSHDVWFDEDVMPPEQWEWVWSPEGVNIIFGEGQPFPGAVEYMRALNNIARVRIISAAPDTAHVVRIKWLRQQGMAYDEIRFVDVNVHGHTAASPKSAVLPHADIYLDDSASNCNDLAQNTDAIVLLLDQKWNRSPSDWSAVELDPRVTRVFNWSEVLETVMSWSWEAFRGKIEGGKQ